MNDNQLQIAEETVGRKFSAPPTRDDLCEAIAAMSVYLMEEHGYTTEQLSTLISGDQCRHFAAVAQSVAP
ncbi:MAG TPA: hypothetical protein PLF81_26730 [Candidatus Anammoximicrobium sp.]|mgnify:CR=1 FL=1|nr:hypothetical protein [Candidatus Anammoximicrobium sp.]